MLFVLYVIRPSGLCQGIPSVARVDPANIKTFTGCSVDQAEGIAKRPHQPIAVLGGCEGGAQALDFVGCLLAKLGAERFTVADLIRVLG